jgi:hypothetical protein
MVGAPRSRYGPVGCHGFRRLGAPTRAGLWLAAFDRNEMGNEGRYRTPARGPRSFWRSDGRDRNQRGSGDLVAGGVRAVSIGIFRPHRRRAACPRNRQHRDILSQIGTVTKVPTEKSQDVCRMRGTPEEQPSTPAFFEMFRLFV